MKVGTLHARVTSVGPSLASKDHSHAQSVISAILKRGYYRPQVNLRTPSSLSSIIDVSLIITPPFLGIFISLTQSSFFEEGPSFLVPSLFLLVRKVLSNYTKTIMEVFELHSR